MLNYIPILEEMQVTQEEMDGMWAYIIKHSTADNFVKLPDTNGSWRSLSEEDTRKIPPLYLQLRKEETGDIFDEEDEDE